MSLLSFARSKIVGVEHPEQDTLLAHGILDDNIYSLELDVEVKLPLFEITRVEGRWRRYTTVECPHALAKLQNAVGLRIVDKEFGRKIRQVVGKEGCTHFANLLLECCDGIRQAAVYGEWVESQGKRFAQTKRDYCRSKFETVPGLRNSCIVYSRMSKEDF